jgi:hypothetical protein
MKPTSILVVLHATATAVMNTTSEPTLSSGDSSNITQPLNFTTHKGGRGGRGGGSSVFGRASSMESNSGLLALALVGAFGFGQLFMDFD